MKDDKKITGDDLLRMIPGLKEAMGEALERCGLRHDHEPVEEAINNSPFKDAIVNNTSPKKKAAKAKVEKLQRK
jgi:hypothetical protein